MSKQAARAVQGRLASAAAAVARGAPSSPRRCRSEGTILFTLSRHRTFTSGSDSYSGGSDNSVNTVDASEDDSIRRGRRGHASGFKLDTKQRRALRLAADSEGAEPDDDSGLDDLSGVLGRLEAESAEQDRRACADNPAPWHELLVHPARAAWRSSPHPPPGELTDVRADVLKKTGRTSRQLRRTWERIVESHDALAERRERERRRLVNNPFERMRKDSIRQRQRRRDDSSVNTVLYGPEYTAANLRYRLVPNYLIARRVLREARSLLGRRKGDSKDGGEVGPWNMSPSRIIDVGIGVGAASAAALDVFGAENVEWIHGVDPSRSMRDAAGMMLEGVLRGGPSNDESAFSSEAGSGFSVDGHRIMQSLRERGGRTRTRTRVTLGESLTSLPSSASIDFFADHQSGALGTFDLALLTYTASELPHVASTLALAAVLWEKLAPGGVLVVIEPGTPDGFGSVRAVRNMLLDCCPPSDVDLDGRRVERYPGDEECHVVSPCTHSGRCPMERHSRDHLAKKYGLLRERGGSSGLMIDEEVVEEIPDDTDEDPSDYDAPWDKGEGSFRWDADAIRLLQGHPDWEDLASSDGRERGDYDDRIWDDIEGGGGGDDVVKGSDLGSSVMARAVEPDRTAVTDAFDSAFCSFVHAMPTQRRKGEKFSYLVVQKRIAGREHGRPASAAAVEEEEDEEEFDIKGKGLNLFGDTNVAAALAASLDAGRAEFHKRSGKKDLRVPSDLELQMKLMTEAVALEDQYIDSEWDPLALELVGCSDESRGSWGRIVRAPIKKKRHVMIDFCSSAWVPAKSDGGSGEEETEEEEEERLEASEGTERVWQGRIVRHAVSRRVSSRMAPGMYGAARKARWGGLWPDVSNRLSVSSSSENGMVGDVAVPGTEGGRDNKK